MNTINRKELAFKMRDLGIRNQSRVWNAVNQGNTPDEIEALIATILREQDAKDNIPIVALNHKPIDYPIFGQNIIETVTIEDMNAVARLPYVTQVALMPDAHRVKPGHVPVGGVVVTEDCILPGVVGSDIACSVRFITTNWQVDNNWFFDNRDELVSLLETETWFGTANNDTPREELLECSFFEVVSGESVEDFMLCGLKHEESRKLFKRILSIAPRHFGTSGDGNHFAELGITDIHPARAYMRDGSQLAILTHFGSRGPGAQIAKFYLAKANELHKMPKGLEDNAPLFFDTDGWAEDYLLMMNWAGNFARESHLYLHNRVLDALKERMVRSGLESVFSVYTQHNFAWYENGVYIHRKGATPAHEGTLGVIPATMGDTSVIVEGLGNTEYLNSSSHGAGRRMSRSIALRSLENTREYVMKEYGVVLSGGGEDEDPRAYKRIDDVMQFQADSVKVVGAFTPRIVRMSPPRRWKGKS